MLVNYISKMFDHSFAKQWYETYWAIDLHGTIIKPTYNGVDVEYYPYAKEVMQILTKRPDIKIILWTSSFPQEIVKYRASFALDKIYFDSINENPGISSKNGNFGYYEKKFYCNVMIDDKAGFDPKNEWKHIFEFLIACETINFFPNPNWTTKF